MLNYGAVGVLLLRAAKLPQGQGGHLLDTLKLGEADMVGGSFRIQDC